MTNDQALSPNIQRIYLDHNATTPISSLIKERMPAWLEQWGNASSIHWSGREPKALLRDARRHFARLIHADPLELIFTGGGSEANNLAIKGVFEALRLKKMQLDGPRDQYIISSVEHPSVTKTVRALEAQGARVDVIGVDRHGAFDLDAYAKVLSPRTALVSVMFANNETGSVFQVGKLAKMAHKVGALFHSDCVQALGKTPLDVKTLGLDLATFSGHKFYALKGVGVLYARAGLNLEPHIYGGGQERGRRAGTENVIGIAAMGALAEHYLDLTTPVERVTALRDEMEKQILSRISDVRVTGAGSLRIGNTSSLIIGGVDGETLLMNLDMRGISVSTGAACSSGSPEPSPVLMSMGLTRAEAQSSLRVSLGFGTTGEELAQFVTTLEEVVTRLRGFRHGEMATYGI